MKSSSTPVRVFVTFLRLTSLFLLRVWLVLMLTLTSLVSQPAQPVQALSFNAQINVSFSPLEMYAGDVTRMTIEIFNPNGFVLENTSFTNDLEGRQPGLRLADPINLSIACYENNVLLPDLIGGTLIASPGGKIIQLSGGTIPAHVGPHNGRCSIGFDVTANRTGNLINSIPAYAVPMYGGQGLHAVGRGGLDEITNINTADATILIRTVESPLMSKIFNPPTVWVGQPSELTINIQNTDSVVALTGATFIDTLPSPFVVANPLVASLTNCGTAALIAATPGGTTVGLTGGVIPPGTTCSVQVNVLSTTQAEYVNTIPAGPVAPGSLQTNQGVTNTSPISAPINVQAVGITKNFTPGTFVEDETTTLTITLRNPTGVDYTNVNLVDNLPTGLQVASFNANQCGGTVAYSEDDNRLTLTGGTIPAGSVTTPGFCVIQAQVTSNSPGSHTNTIGSGDLTGDGLTNVFPVSASVTVLPRTIEVGKSFSPGFIGAGEIATLTVVLRNRTSQAFTNVSFIDQFMPLDTTLEIVDPPAALASFNASPSCGPGATLTKLSSTSFQLTGAIVPAGTPTEPGTCTVSVQVTSNDAGTFFNQIPANTVSSGEGVGNASPSNNASMTVYLGENADLSKTFGPSTLLAGNPATLTLTIRSPHDTSLSGIAFSDTLPDGMIILASPAPTNSCGGSLLAAPGTRLIRLTDGAIPTRNATCTIQVPVTVTGAGTFTNTIPPGALTSFEGRTDPTPTTATLRASSLQIGKNFSPDTISPDGRSRLTITLTNTNTVPLVDLSVTDNLTTMNLPGDDPGVDGVYIASPANAVSTCGGVITAVPDTQIFQLTGGIIPASDGLVPGLCTVSFDVQGRGIDSTRINTITTNNVLATIFGTATTINPVGGTSDSLTITPLQIQIVKGFDPVAVFGGSYSTLTITLVNPSDSASLSQIAFSDIMPAGMLMATPVNFNVGTCGGSLERDTVDPVRTFHFSGGSLPPAGECSMTLHATMDVIGNRTNVIPAGEVTTLEGATNPDGTEASLTNLPGANLTKSFAPNPVPAGDISLLTIRISNTSNVALTGMGMVDELPGFGLLPDGLEIAPAPPATNSCGGTLTAIPGAQTIQLSNGVLANDATCEIVVPVLSSVPGSYPNIILAGGLSNEQGWINKEPAEDTLLVTAFSLGNRVWEDVNNNGLRDASETGIGSLTVNLYEDSDADGVPDGPTPIATMTTDPNGYYRFDNLAAGTYLVGVTPPAGYVSSTIKATGPGIDDDNDGITLTATGEVLSGPVTLGPGANEPVGETDSPTGADPGPGEAPDNQSNRTIDFGFFRAYSLGNRVWLDDGAGGGIANDGIRQDGELGIAGVRVNLYNQSGTLINFTWTDADGYYRFDNLVAGEYVVEVVTPAGYANTAITGGAPGIDNDNDGVFDTGSLVRSNPVTLGPGASEPTGESDPATNPLPGEAPDNQSNRTVDFGFVLGYSLGNLVWFDNGAGGGTANDGIRDSGEPGINGVPVNLYRPGFGPDGIPGNADDNDIVATTITADGGYYRFDGLMPGEYVVEIVRPSGYQNTFIPATGNDPNNNIDNDNNGFVVSGSNLRSNLVTLGPGPSEPTDDNDPATNPQTGEAPNEYSNRTVDFGLYYQPYSLGNRVWADDGGGDPANADNGIRDPGEPGLAGVPVYLFRADEDGVPDGGPIAFTTTDSQGYYRFDDLQAGTYLVRVTAPTGYYSSSVDAVNPGVDDNVDNGIGIGTGFVWSSPVTLGPDASEPTDDNDPVTNPLPGEAPNAYSNRTIDFGFAPLASVGDRVWNDVNQDGIQDPGETGVVGVTVTLYDSSNNQIAQTVTNGGGYYFFPNLYPGEYYVVVSVPAGYEVSPQNVGTDDALDSDIDGTGRTANFTLAPGQDDLTWDAGIYQPPASIGNYVWLDTNQDGIQDASESGIEGVTVYLYRPGYGADGIPDTADDDLPVASTLTDSNGEYLFEDLTPGEYYLLFVPPAGYAISPMNQGGDDELDSDADPLTYQTALTTLSPGENDLTWDAGMYLAPASLGNRVWEDLNGNGLQDGGEPGVENVTVNLYRPGYGPDGIPGNDDDDDIVAIDTTDSNGEYGFSGLTPGEYYVEFIRPAGYVITFIDQGADDAIDSDADPSTGQTALITLVADQNDPDWDMGILQTVSLGDYVWSDLDRNGIQDAGEPGIEDVRVDLYTAAGAWVATTTTDSDGAYLFNNLRPGDYYLVFTPPTGGWGFSPQDQGGDDTLDSDVDPATGQTAVFSLTSGNDDMTRDAGLFQFASLGNYVWYDLNQDGVQDASESGVNGVTVNLYDSADNLVRTTVTANDGLNDGAYLFENLVPGSYYVEFVLPTGYDFSPRNQGGDAELDSDADPATGQTSLIPLAPGQNDLSWDAGIYQPKASLGDFVWEDLNGNGIQDPLEPGINGVTVELYNQAGVLVATTVTANNGVNDGAYQFTDLEPGYYYLKFIAPDGYIVTLSDQGGDDERDSDALVPNLTTVLIYLAPGQNDPTWDAGFARPVAIGNRVWYDTGPGAAFNNGIFDSGEIGVPNLRVDLYTAADNSLLASTITDIDGRYYFSNLLPGDYYVLIPASQFAPGLPLAGYTSSTGAGVNPADDDDVDENGIDDLDFLTNGIRSQVYTLIAGSMREEEDQSGYSGTLPAPGDDASINATVDFGFVPAIAFSKVLTTTEVSEAGNDHTQAVIGETVTYTLTATFGQASTPDVFITDVLDDGLALLSVDSITNPDGNLTSSAGAPLSTIVPTVTDSGRSLSFDFGAVTNASPTNAPESIIIVYRAVVLNVDGNQQTGTTLNNTAQMAWDGPRSPLSAAADEVTVVEPTLTITKEPLPTSGLDAGDELVYTFTIENTSTVTAYDITVNDDPLPTYYNAASFTAVRNPLSDNEDVSAYFEFDAANTIFRAKSPADLLLLALTPLDLAPGDTLVIVINGAIADNTPVDAVLANTVDLTWTSLDGDFSAPRSPHNSDSVERDGRDGLPTSDSEPLNNYAAQAVSQDAITKSLVLSKSIVATSEAHTTGTDVAIGEIVRFRLLIEIPEGTNIDLKFEDDLPRGLTFLDDDSATIAFVCTDTDAPGCMTSSNGDLSGAGLVVAGDENTIASITPTFDVPESVISTIRSLPNPRPRTFATGDTVYFRLDTVVNSDNDSSLEYVVIEFNALVDNSVAGNNNDGDTLENLFIAFVNDDQSGDPSNTVTVTVREPEIDIAKTITNPSPATNIDAGDTVDFQIVFTNLNTAIPANTTDAFDVVLTDDLVLAGLPFNNLTNVLVSYSGVSCPAAGSESTVVTAGTQLVVTFPQIGASCQVTITYTATATVDIAPSQTYTNTARIEYSSLPGTGTAGNPTGSNTPGGSGAENGERNHDTGASGDANNDYSGSDTASLTSRPPSMVKELVTTEFNVAGNDHTQGVIGELLTYQLVITVPEGTTPNLQVVDTLDPGLVFVDCVSVTPSLNVSTDLAGGFGDACLDDVSGNPAITGAGGVATYNFGTVTNSNTDNLTPDTITVVYTVMFTNVIDNQNNTTSGTTGLNNSAALSWTGGSQAAVSAPNVRVVEPTLTIDKDRTATGLDAGDTTTFSVTIANGNAVSDTFAYDVVFTDVIPVGLTYVPSPTLVVCTTSASPVFAYDSGTRTLSAGWDVFETNASCTFTFNTTLDASVEPGQTIAANVGRVDWTSISGDRQDYSPYNTASDERTGADGLPGTGILNDYRRQDITPAFNVQQVAPQKALVATSESHTSGADVAIGEIVRYRLALQVPEGAITNLQLRDALPDGLTFLNDDTARFAYLANGGLTANDYAAGSVTGATCANTTGDFNLTDVINPATLASSAIACAFPNTNSISTSETAEDDAYASGTDVSFKFGNLVNGDSDANAEFIVVEFNALVDNALTADPNDDGDARINTFQPRSGATLTNLGPASNEVTVTVREPEIPFNATENNKTITSPIPASDIDASDTVSYQIVYINEGSTDAFDVVVTDDMGAAGLPFTNLTNINTSFSAACSATPGDVSTAGTDADTLVVTVPRVEVDCAVTITYDVTATVDIAPSQTYTNIARIVYSSLPGTGTAGNPTGSNTPGGSGAENGERNHDTGASGGANNDYSGSDTAQITSASLIPEKAIIATSEAHTAETLPGAADLAIGEIITYRLTVSVPEGTSNAFVISDVLPAGLGYIPGSARIYTNSALAMTFADLAGVPNTSPGLVIPTDGDGALPAAPGTLFFDSPTRELQINVGDILNQDNDPDAEDIIIEFQALVLNTGTNNQGTALENQFEVSVNADTPVASNTVSSTVLEPNISNLAKSVTSAGPLYDAGDTVAYRLTYSNTGATDAFEVRVLDVLDSTYFTLGSITVDLSNSVCVAGHTNDSVGNTLDVTVNQVPVGCQVVIEYEATLKVAVEPESTYPNTADLTYTSLPGDKGTGDVTPGDPGDSDGERNHDTGASGGANNDYSGSDTANINTGSGSIAKALESTSAAHTGSNDLAVGEVATFGLYVTLPEGTTPSLTVTDELPAGMEYVSGSAQLITTAGATCGALTADFNGSFSTDDPVITAPGGSGGDVTFTFGQITVAADNDTANNTFVICFDAVLLNEAGNQNGDTLTNTASFQIGSGPVLTDSADVDVIEPELTISKQAGNLTPAIGDTFTYTLVVEHLGTSTSDAFELIITDNIPSGLTFDAFVTTPAVCTPDDSAVPTLTWTCASLSLGDSLTFIYRVTVDMPPPPPAPGDDLTNTVSLDWTSLPGADSNERTGNDGPGGALDDYAVSTDATVTLTNPDLTVTKTDGQDTYVPGLPLTYTITVSNVGNGGVIGATVSDPIPAQIGSWAWTCTSTGSATCAGSGGSISTAFSDTVDMPAGSTITYTVVAQVRSSATGDLANTVTVTPPAGVTDPTPGNNTATDTDTADPQADLSVTKDDGVSQYVPGGSLTYTIVVSNAGPSDVIGATVSDPIPAQIGSWAWTCTSTGGATCAGSGGSISTAFSDTVDMPAGSTITYTVVAQVRSSATGDLANTVTVTPPAGVTDPTPGNNTATDTDTADSQADLSVTKDDGVSQYVPGGSLTYTIVVSNAGPSDVIGATVSDPIPAQIGSWAWTCAPAGGATCAGSGGSISTAFSDTVDMPAGSTITYTVVAQVRSSATGDLANTVTVTPPAGVTDPTPGNNTATDTDTADPQADLSVTKDDGVSQYVPGGSLTYTIVVSNAGPSDVIGATVSDPIPAQIGSWAWTCTSTGGATCAGSGGSISTAFSDTVDMPAGSTITYTVVAQVRSSATGDLANTVTVTPPAGVTDPTPGNNTATDTDTADSQADLSVTKDDGVSQYVPGGSLTYTIVVSNAGPSDVIGATVSDPIPAQIGSWAWTCTSTGGATCAGSGGSISTAFSDTVDMPAGSTITYTVVAQVRSSATGDLANTVTVTPPAGVTDPTPGNNTATDTDTADSQADLSVTKDDGVSQYVPGGSLTYTIVVSNAGPSDVIGATVSDPIPAQIGSWAWTCTSTGGATCAGSGGSISTAFSDTVDMPVGSTITYTVVAQVRSSATGDLANTVTVTPPAGVTDPTPGNNTAIDTDTADPQADLSITKVASPVGYYLPGSTIEYTIVVTNNGPADVTGVLVEDYMPVDDGGDPLFTNWDWVCTSETGGASGCTAYNGAGGFFSDTVNLPLGGSITYTVTATIRDDASGPIENRVEVTPPAGVSETNTNNNADDVTNEPARLTVTKDDGLTVVAPGSIITYTIEVTNNGAVDLTDITVTDTLPADVTFQGATPDPATAPDVDDPGGEVTWTGVSLVSGDSATFTITVQVIAEPGDVFTNLVVAEDGNTGQRDEDEDTNLTAVDTGKVTRTPTNRQQPRPMLPLAKSSPTRSAWMFRQAQR
jgi:uncharacterized repeat protein (TIGR01451 family)/fimbrial isopeptide formation D2 family protein